MDLSESFIEKLKEKIQSLTEEEFKKVSSTVTIMEVGTKDDLINLLSEDYSVVLDIATELGFTKATACVWCNDCDKEVEVEVDIQTYNWVCPTCGNKGTS